MDDMRDKLYIVSGKTYLTHINNEVHLYGLLHQLASLAGHIKDGQDFLHLVETATRYGGIAEKKLRGSNIPGRYLVSGDPQDLQSLLDKELDEVEAFIEEDGPCEN